MKKIFLGLLLAMQSCLPDLSHATDIKISNLPLGSANTTGGNDSFPYVDAVNTVTKRLQLSKLIYLPSMQTTFATIASPTFTGVATGSFAGSLAGNASTATAFATNPADCASNMFSSAIAANGDLTCSSVGDSALAISYLKADGSRALTGAWSAGQNITATSFIGPLTGNVTGSVTGTASGNTTYTANQYGVVLSGAANTMSVLAPNSSTVFPLISGGISANPSWAALGATGGGTGITSYTLGDTIYSSASNTLSVLSGNTTTTKKFKTQTGNGTISAAPTWSTIANTDLSGIVNAQLSGSAAITNANLAAMASSSSTVGTVKGNISGSSAVPSDIVLTSAATNSSAVYRDSSGNFSATTITAALTGNASTATSATSATTATNIAGGLGGSIPYQSAVNTTVLLANGTSGQFLKSNGTTVAPSWANPTISLTAPTIQKFLSGSGTYTTPASVLYIRVRLIGGGGGGAGSGTLATNGTGGTGGNTTFGSSLLVGNGGVGGSGNSPSNGGTGGTASLGTGPIGIALQGGTGSGALYNGSSTAGPIGGGGASSPFGGAGGGAGINATANAAIANTGSGGGGAQVTDGTSSRSGGAGGGAGGFVDALISSPSATYAYAVGAAGTAGTAGTGGSAGAAGGSGIIEVTEYYQ